MVKIFFIIFFINSLYSCSIINSNSTNIITIPKINSTNKISTSNLITTKLSYTNKNSISILSNTQSSTLMYSSLIFTFNLNFHIISFN